MAKKTPYEVVPQLGKLRDDVLFGDVWEQPELFKAGSEFGHNIGPDRTLSDGRAPRAHETRPRQRCHTR